MDKRLLAGLAAVILIAAGVWFFMNQGQSTMTEAPPVENPPMSPAPPAENAPMTETMMNTGSEAPLFKLNDLEGNTVDLTALKGEKVYVKFWASWCPICLAGLEEVNLLAAEDQGFKVLTVVAPDTNGEKSREDFIQWFNGVEAKNLTVLLDEGGDITRAYGVRGYPTNVLIGSDGTLVKTLPGHLDNARIKELMSGIN